LGLEIIHQDQDQVVAFDSEVPDQDCDADELETINTIRAPYQPQKKILRFLNSIKIDSKTKRFRLMQKECNKKPPELLWRMPKNN
jgi:hypothetical protein